MDGNPVLWALLTGGVTGGVRASIVLVSHRRRMLRERSSGIAAVRRRRLDFAEHRLAGEGRASRVAVDTPAGPA